MRTHMLCKPVQWKRMSRFHTSHFIHKSASKMPGSRMSPECGHTCCASLCSGNACQDFTQATFIHKSASKMPGSRMSPECGHTCCASLRQWKRMSKFHTSHFIHKSASKMPGSRMSPECGRTCCASLCSGNACQDFTQATLYTNLQVKCRGPE